MVEGDTLSEIAQQHLDDAEAWPRIFEASRGIPQPDGRRLTDPDLILPGWHVLIPAAAEATPELPASPQPEQAEPTLQTAKPAPSSAPATPAPSASADAWHVAFPDGAVIEYEPETGALTVSGIKTADVTASESITATVPLVLVKASTSITLDTPEVICTNKLTTATLEVQKGGKMSGNIEHSGGSLSSNGKVLHTHKHPGDSGGTTGAPL